MTKPSGENETTHKWIQGIIGISMPLVVLALGGLATWLMKIDERQFKMNQDYVSKAELKESIAALSQLIKERKSERERAEREILTEIRTTNRAVQQLAITLERRTGGKQ